MINFLSKIIFYIGIITFSVNSFAKTYSGELKNYETQLLEIEKELFEKYKVKKDFSRKVLSSIKFKNKILRIMANAPERKDTWRQYEKKYLTDKRVKDGIDYYRKNINLLEKVESVYGVPPEILVAFLGVETNYGTNTGKIKVIDSLGTLALKHPKRHKFFRAQLINLIVLSYKSKLDYKNLKGSYAGAMGLPQFMPDNYRKLAVDFDKNGSVDLWHSKMDIYASISNFLNNKGWQKGESIYNDKKIKKEYVKEIFKKGDVKTVKISNQKLNEYLEGSEINSGQKYLILLSKKHKKYKIGYSNFKVIMRYNPSTFYAMVVAKLSERIKEGKWK